MFITIIFKAFLAAISLFFVFHIGRCSATRDIYDVRIGASNKMPDDITQWVNSWDKKLTK